MKNYRFKKLKEHYLSKRERERNRDSIFEKEIKRETELKSKKESEKGLARKVR